MEEREREKFEEEHAKVIFKIFIQYVILRINLLKNKPKNNLKRKKMLWKMQMKVKGYYTLNKKGWLKKILSKTCFKKQNKVLYNYQNQNSQMIFQLEHFIYLFLMKLKFMIKFQT